MSKYRIYELAKEFSTSSKTILDILEHNQKGGYFSNIYNELKYKKEILDIFHQKITIESKIEKINKVKIPIDTNKSIIKYPYVNIDVVSNDVVSNNNKTYTFRIYVCDKNEPYIAYNKCELILDTLLNSLEVNNYKTNYFTLSFKDMINGIFADVTIDSTINLSCIVSEEDKEFIVLENSDFIKYFLLKEDGSKIELE